MARSATAVPPLWAARRIEQEIPFNYLESVVGESAVPTHQQEVVYTFPFAVVHMTSRFIFHQPR